MAGIRKQFGKWYARSFYTLKGKQEEFKVCLHNPDEKYITERVAESRRTRYEREYEAEAIENRIKGIKVDKNELDWYSKRTIQYNQNSKTLEQAIVDWLKSAKGERLKKTTISIYESHLRDFKRIVGKSILVKDLKTKHIDLFKQSQKSISINTLHSKLRSINNFLGYCIERVDDYELQSKPIVKKPSLPKSKPVLIPNDIFDSVIEKLYEVYPINKASFLKDIYYLYRCTGLRLGEPFIFELFSNKLKIVAGTTKNSYSRNVYLTGEQVDTIKSMRRYVKRMVRDGKNQRNQIKYFSRIFKTMLRKVGAPTEMHFHNLRDTFATRLYFLYGDIYMVCGALGHSDIKMTSAYTSFDLIELSIAFPDIARIKKIDQTGHNKPANAHSSSLQNGIKSDYFMRITAGVV